jgi:Haem-binding domain
MRVLSLVIVFLILAVIAFGSLLSRHQVDHVSPAVHDYRYAEPFRVTGGKALVRACGNCHSNQTKLPWYGHLVPISWWINRHVREGRRALNFTEWTTYSTRQRRDELESICGVIANGRMPPRSYSALHPEARLGAQDKKAICFWAANEIEQEK